MKSVSSFSSIDIILKNVMTIRMTWNVWGPVVTVATGSSVITWTEVVHLAGVHGKACDEGIHNKVNFTSTHKLDKRLTNSNPCFTFNLMLCFNKFDYR